MGRKMLWVNIGLQYLDFHCPLSLTLLALSLSWREEGNSSSNLRRRYASSLHTDIRYVGLHIQKFVKKWWVCNEWICHCSVRFVGRGGRSLVSRSQRLRRWSSAVEDLRRPATASVGVQPRWPRASFLRGSFFTPLPIGILQETSQMPSNRIPSALLITEVQ